MRVSLSLHFLLSCLIGFTISCTNVQTKSVTTNQTDTTIVPPSAAISPVVSITLIDSTNQMIDPRDGEIYAIVKIGNQTWMAENLRYNAVGSIINLKNPSKAYGRLYKINTAQTACLDGWHLPSDAEWDEVEMAHGMPAFFIGKSGWRGEHAANMRSVTGWKDDDGNTNSLGFNVLPAGYYTSEEMGFPNVGLEGLGFSAAFWSSIDINVGYARFMFSAKKFVNKWEDTNNDSNAGLSCRCIKNQS